MHVLHSLHLIMDKLGVHWEMMEYLVLEIFVVSLVKMVFNDKVVPEEFAGMMGAGVVQMFCVYQV